MAVRRMSMDGPADKCSCIIRTSTIRGGRITQGARMAVRRMSRDGPADKCSSATAPALPTKLHPCNDALSALPPSVVVVYRKEPWMAVRRRSQDGGVNMPAT